MSIKKAVTVTAMAMAMLLCGCDNKADVSVQQAEDTSVSDVTDVLSETTSAESTSAEIETSVSASETTLESITLSEVSEGDSGDGLFSGNEPYVTIGLRRVGGYERISDAKLTAITMSGIMKEMLTEEYYTENIKDSEFYSDYESFEEYKEDVLETYGISEEDFSAAEDYSVFFYVMSYSTDENADYSAAGKCAFEHVIGRLEGKDIEPDENEPANSIVICYGIDGDNLFVDAEGYISDEYCEISNNEYTSLSGKEIITVGKTPVPADTKSLYISAYDESRANILDDSAHNEYDVVIYDYSVEKDEFGHSFLDTAELAEKLPNLEKLYLSAYVDIGDLSAFSNFENLRELHIDVMGWTDISALSGLKTDRLEISGLSCPADVFAELDVDEICISCTPSEGMLESIYKLKNVSELTIGRFSDTEPIFEGIGNMSGLKKLDISADPEFTVDFAPLAELDNVTELEITAYNTENLDKIAEMKSVRSLMLHSMDKDDLSFLSEMTGLEDLSLMYVNRSFGSSLKNLKGVKELCIIDTSDDFDMRIAYGYMENLEGLTVSGEYVTSDGIDNLKKLKKITLMNASYGDLSGLKECDSLEELNIIDCSPHKFNARDIEGMTQLKKFYLCESEISGYKSLKTLTGLEEMKLYDCDLTSEEQEALQEALPECEFILKY